MLHGITAIMRNNSPVGAGVGSGSFARAGTRGDAPASPEPQVETTGGGRGRQGRRASVARAPRDTDPADGLATTSRSRRLKPTRCTLRVSRPEGRTRSPGPVIGTTPRRGIRGSLKCEVRSLKGMLSLRGPGSPWPRCRLVAGGPWQSREPMPARRDVGRPSCRSRTAGLWREGPPSSSTHPSVHGIATAAWLRGPVGSLKCEV